MTIKDQWRPLGQRLAQHDEKLSWIALGVLLIIVLSYFFV